MSCRPEPSQTLTVKLVPQSGRPLQLAVTCDQAPASGEATVDVQEPRLQMEITGPAEVMFGKSQRYALTLSNPGTGDAEDVLIELVPPGGNVQTPVRHKVGALAAGATKTIELELTAREAGELKMQAAAIAAGDLRAEATKTRAVPQGQARRRLARSGQELRRLGGDVLHPRAEPGHGAGRRRGRRDEPARGRRAGRGQRGPLRGTTRGTRSRGSRAQLAAGEERFMQVQCKLTKPGVEPAAVGGAHRRGRPERRSQRAGDGRGARRSQAAGERSAGRAAGGRRRRCTRFACRTAA